MILNFAVARAASKGTSPQSSPLVQIDSRDVAVKIIVTDATGAVIPEAEVIINDERHQQLTGVTDWNGVSSFSHRAAGQYAITVEHAGFKTKFESLVVPQSVAVTMKLDVAPTIDVIYVDGPNNVLPPDASLSVQSMMGNIPVKELFHRRMTLPELRAEPPRKARHQSVKLVPSTVARKPSF